MSLAILGAVGKMVASTIFSQIAKYLFKPDPVDIDAILAGQQKIIDLITELDYKSQIREPMNLIYYWTQRMQEVVDDINRTNSSQASLDAYNDVMSALRNQSSGVRYQTFVIYNAIMGTTSPLGTDGMLLYWEDQGYKKLTDNGNFSYHMREYVNDLETDITAVFALLHHGLELSFFTATDSGDADRLKSECTNRMSTIRDTVWNNYPNAIRTLKNNSYDDPGWGIMNDWFNFVAGPGDLGGIIVGNYVIINDFYCRELGLGIGTSGRAFSFLPNQPDSANFLGPQILHAYWKDHTGNARVGFYSGLPDGLTPSKAFTNTASYASTNMIIKFIPLKQTTNSHDWARFVTYNGSSWVGPDDNQTFNPDFYLVITHSLS